MPLIVIVSSKNFLNHTAINDVALFLGCRKCRQWHLCQPIASAITSFNWGSL